MAAEERRPPLPTDPLECRQRADALLTADHSSLDAATAAAAAATAWAQLAVAGELAVIRRALKGR